MIRWIAALTVLAFQAASASPSIGSRRVTTHRTSEPQTSIEGT